MLNWLRGKRTYLIALLMFAVNGLVAGGIITQEQGDLILKLLATLGLITIRAAIAKVVEK